MESVSVNKFRDNLKTFVEAVASRHEPLRVTRRNGTDFVVMSLDDWESEQETLYTLQNSSLMRQIRAAQITHEEKQGYIPTSREMDEILAAANE
ncbi:MAG: type II toxin-antitoxin system Phd/YefM family antitoxin [Phormidesmis sp.]